MVSKFILHYQIPILIAVFVIYQVIAFFMRRAKKKEARKYSFARFFFPYQELFTQLTKIEQLGLYKTYKNTISNQDMLKKPASASSLDSSKNKVDVVKQKKNMRVSFNSENIKQVRLFNKNELIMPSPEKKDC